MSPSSLNETLQRARGALTPAASERARVLERLGVRFPELASSAAPSGAAADGFWRALRATGAGGASLGAGLVAAGFIAGYAVKAELPAPREPIETSAIAPAPVSSTAGDEPGSATPTSSQPLAAPRATPEGGEPDVIQKNSARLERSARTSPPAVTEPAMPEPRSQLEQELLVLQRAERALRNGNPALALALLAELDAQHARPLLGEERAATRLMASCQADSPGASAAARSFLESHPRSVYGDRMRESCLLGTDATKAQDAATDDSVGDIDER